MAPSNMASFIDAMRPSKNKGPSKQEMDQAESAVINLVSRVKELYSLYQMYGVQYQGMGATTRRFLAVTAPTTDNQVRQIVYAKFLLAAVMEWAPTDHYFALDAFLAAGGPVFKTDATNELCPYWEGFFADVHNGAMMLGQIGQEPHLALQRVRLEHILSLVEQAEVKAGWVNSLLQTVANSTSIPGFKAPAHETEPYRVWNQLCLSIGNGMTVPDAVLRFREAGNTLPKHPLPTPLTQATQQRIWFAFDMYGQPWLAHAQAINQQPHHLVPSPVLRGEWADEAQLWVLPKTTDTRVNHHHCSVFAPCCSRLHVHCAAHSPCKIWGPQDCPHVRAGAVSCEDKHCMMVDWSKYNLCVSAAYEGQMCGVGIASPPGEQMSAIDARA